MFSHRWWRVATSKLSLLRQRSDRRNDFSFVMREFTTAAAAVLVVLWFTRANTFVLTKQPITSATGLSLLRAAERDTEHSCSANLPQVLVLTDLGKDIDDSIALLLLARQAQLGRLRIAGLVAGGGSTHQRARASETILHAALRTKPRAVLAPAVQDEVPCFAGSDVPISESMREDPIWNATVLADVSGGAGDASRVPEKSDGSAGAQLIVDLCKRHGRDLKILCIGPVTDLALALRLDEEALRSAGSIHFQGQCVVDNAEALPDSAAFNFRCDMDAAMLVIQSLHPHVPMWMVGKHAAYQIQLSSEHFQRWDGAAGHWPRPRFLDAVLEGLVHLSAASPATFARVFGDGPAAAFAASAEGGASHDELAGLLPFLSCPYDALAVLSLLPEARQHFDVETVGAPDRRGGGVVHLVGNSPPNRGVKDPSRTRHFIVNAVCAALSRSYVGSGPDDTSFSAVSADIQAGAGPPPAHALDPSTIPPRSSPLRVVVGTTNQMKINCVREALRATHRTVTVEGVPTASGVPGQPIGGSETFGGAANRARQARKAVPEADIWLGLENGLVSVGACVAGSSVLPPQTEASLGSEAASGPGQWLWFEMAACGALCRWTGDTLSAGSSMGVQLPLNRPPDCNGPHRPHDWFADYVGYFHNVQAKTAGFDTALHHSGGLLARPELLEAATTCAVGRLLHSEGEGRQRQWEANPGANL